MANTGTLSLDDHRNPWGTWNVLHGASALSKPDTDWTFGGAWPYAPKYFNTPDGRLHYIDEGPRNAPPIVFVHGNPTWGYLYRRFIKAVTGWEFRAIAMDHLGFGRSDKPTQTEVYTIPRHADRCEALLEALDLGNATLVVQDWGGPIGLSWAARHPERVSGLFILNTFFQRPVSEVPLPAILKAFRTPVVGELLVKGAHAFVKGFLFQAGLNDPARLTRTDKTAYLAPHPTWSSRSGVLAFPRQIPSGPTGPVSDFVAIEGAKLEAAFAKKPVKIVWPMKDVAFSPETLDGMWLKAFPHAQVTRVEDAGHFIQEDAPEIVIPELMDFIGGTLSASGRSR
jgi:pimeloyl-ACP methyl ester carboxylesterase